MHAHPTADVSRAATHYQTARQLTYCGPYRVCEKHPGTTTCHECGYGARTTRVWHDDPDINEYILHCSANSYPYRYTTS